MAAVEITRLELSSTELRRRAVRFWRSGCSAASSCPGPGFGGAVSGGRRAVVRDGSANAAGLGSPLQRSRRGGTAGSQGTGCQAQAVGGAGSGGGVLGPFRSGPRRGWRGAGRAQRWRTAAPSGVPSPVGASPASSAGCRGARGSQKNFAALLPRTQSDRKQLAVPTPEPPQPSRLRFVWRNRRGLLRGVERSRPGTRHHSLHCLAPMGRGRCLMPLV